MKSIYILLFVTSFFTFFSCRKDEVFEAEHYGCPYAFSGNGNDHPKSDIYQEILDRNRKLGIVGASMMIADKDGVWLGSSGKADIASQIDVKPCDRFLIASITKVFTAAAVFSFIDDGVLKLDDPISKWLDEEIIDKVDNARESSIKHLLNHTSGIPDYYTTAFELDRINKYFNDWRQEDILTYTYNQSATHPVGETYEYSNTNFLLLGMILENAGKKRLDMIFQEKIFNPLQLSSAYYGIDRPIPPGTVKGYADVYGNGQYVESEFLYKDELNSADGGMTINAHDLGRFFQGLMNGSLISDESLANMTSWADLPADYIDEDFGHFQNGLGLEHNKTPYGNSVGHTGGIDGFLSIAQYFPEHEAVFVLLVNSGSYENLPRLNIYRESLEVMFE